MIILTKDAHDLRKDTKMNILSPSMTTSRLHGLWISSRWAATHGYFSALPLVIYKLPILSVLIDNDTHSKHFNIKVFIAPSLPDLDEIDPVVLENVKFVPVTNAAQIIDCVLLNNKSCEKTEKVYFTDSETTVNRVSN